jgi:hypothetical protein
MPVDSLIDETTVDKATMVGSPGEIHAMSMGIKANEVSDADILSFSIQASAKKRAREGSIGQGRVMSSQTSAAKFSIFTFDGDESDGRSSMGSSSSEHPIYDMDTDEVQEAAENVPDVDDSDYILLNHCSTERLSEEWTGQAACEDSGIVSPVALPVSRAPTPQTKGELKKVLQERVADAVEYQILDILNKGSMERLLELKLIGPSRANRILELRSEGVLLTSVGDLREIGMSDKTIASFMKSNLPAIVGI